MLSLERSGRVAVPLEGTVDDIRALVDEVRHDGLRLGAVPGNVSGLSESVPVDSFVGLMVDGSLSSSPLSMGVRNWRVLGESSAEIPPEEIWVVQKSSEVELVVVGNQRSLVSETTAKTSVDEVKDPEVSEDASSVEGFDGELSDGHKTEKASNLGSGGVVGPVEVGSLGRSDNHLVSVGLGEPRLENIEVFLSLISPSWGPLFDLVGRNTKANQFFILPIVSDLIVKHSSLTIIIGVLK